MRNKKLYAGVIIFAGLLYSLYVFGSYIFYTIGLNQIKLEGNHSYYLTKIIEGYFKQFPDVGSYSFAHSERQHIDGKDPGIYNKNGQIVFFLKNKSQPSIEFKEIKISYFDKNGNIQKTYDGICKRNFFENCTPLLISEEILNYPEILQKIISVLKKPCDGETLSYYKDNDVKTSVCKNKQDGFGKIILGLTDSKEELKSIIVIIRENMFGKFL